MSPEAGPAVYLAESPSPAEHDILRRWVRTDGGGASRELVLMPHPRLLDAADTTSAFARRLAASDDPLLAPVRVVWVPKERDGDRSARVRDLVLGDPRHPAPWRQRRLLRTQPDRARVVEGEPARLSELSHRFAARDGDPDDLGALAHFVARQATLALERAEYRALGARYKVPRLVRDEILSSPRFRSGVSRLAAELGRPQDEVRGEAEACLDEMVTGYSRLLLDLMVRFGRAMVRPGYGDGIDYDPDQVERVRVELERHPAVILPSHKSHLDGLVTPIALYENGLPRTHTFAGINMDIWPFGPVLRRAGRIFIRRSTRKDPVDRWVLREYLGYVVEKRFTLEWYIEGTRSRTGKLQPPKLGLLRYVVDAYGEGRTDDIALVPVSIIYDQLHEVSEFSSEMRGGTKGAESLAWAIRFYRAQRRSFGKVYVRFGEPLSLQAALGPPGVPSDEDTGLGLQKLAFEVCTRINAVTPITASALVCLALLATRGRALTAEELTFVVGSLLDHARGRHLPLAASAGRLDTVEGVESVAASLSSNHTIELYDQGPQRVYAVARGQHHSAAFYRNTIIHFFVGGSIAELALVHAAEHDGDRMEAFWEEAFRLRDLLKFEFFFEQKDAFRKALASELTERLPAWEARLGEGADPNELLEELQPLQAFAVLRPFVEAYAVAARTLLDQAPGPVDETAFLAACAGLGEQLVRQQVIRSPESVSRPLFRNALQLAGNRGLTEAGEGARAGRRSLAAELGDIERRLDVIEQRTYDALDVSLIRARSSQPGPGQPSRVSR